MIECNVTKFDDGVQFPTLYTYDSKGRARQWNIQTHSAQVIIHHGLVDGKKAEKVTTSKAKNTGKVNATTPEEQAIKDAQSKWNAQVDREDYHTDIEQSGLQVRPMLAHDYTKVPHRVNWEDTHAQPKLDGLRLTAGSRNRLDIGGPVEFLTRKGETYHLPHLHDEVDQFLKCCQEECVDRVIALDGEVYIHGMPLGQIVSRARKYKEGATEQLEYHLFDLVIPDMTFVMRYDLLKSVYDRYSWSDKIQLVPSWPLLKEELKEWHGEFVQQGYEGLMIRHGFAGYAIGQRSADLFKYKEFYDKECLIIDVWEDQNGNAMLTCLWDHNDPTSEFRCTPKRTHAERKQMLGNKNHIMGKWITVKYQDISYATHEGGLPTFNCGLDLRECDDQGNPIV